MYNPSMHAHNSQRQPDYELANGDPSGVNGKAVEEQLAIVRCDPAQLLILTSSRHRSKAFQMAEGYVVLVDENEVRRRHYKKILQEVWRVV